MLKLTFKKLNKFSKLILNSIKKKKNIKKIKIQNSVLNVTENSLQIDYQSI